MQVVETTQRKLDRAVKAIHRDLDLKDEAKRRMIENVHSQARDEVMHELQAERERLEVEMRIARRKAFSPPVIETEGRSPDPVVVQQAYMRAYESIAAERDRAVLERLFQRAELLNDPFLAKAILVRGYELGNSMLVGRYFDIYEDERGYWDDFIEKAEAYNAHEKSMSMFGASSRLRPLESYLA